MKNKKKKDEFITARVPSAVKKKLQQAADKGYRTLSQEVEMRILKSLENK